jgi:hypothetical protein
MCAVLSNFLVAQILEQLSTWSVAGFVSTIGRVSQRSDDTSSFGDSSFQEGTVGGASTAEYFVRKKRGYCFLRSSLAHNFIHLLCSTLHRHTVILIH